MSDTAAATGFVTHVSEGRISGMVEVTMQMDTKAFADLVSTRFSGPAEFLTLNITPFKEES